MLFPLLDTTHLDHFQSSIGTNDHLKSEGISPLGSEYLMNTSGNLIFAHSGAASLKPTQQAAANNALTPTLVGSSGGLRFDLIWDSSVANAPTGFEAAIIAAATVYTKLFSNKDVINIQVGYGEVAGTRMGAGALGESESYGYLTNYQTVNTALQKDAVASTYQQSADMTLSALDPTHGGQFFVTSAQAKALGLSNAMATAVDGYIGLSSAYPMDYAANIVGNKIAANQFDAIGNAEHEISEIMGRIGTEGALMNGKATYTPLDLFRYTSDGVRDVTPSVGYFSINGGRSNLSGYNNPHNGGDAADWATANGTVGASYDAYNAFTSPGATATVSPVDIIEDAVLGYRLTTAGVAEA
jgi:hypothetical protein